MRRDDLAWVDWLTKANTLVLLALAPIYACRGGSLTTHMRECFGEERQITTGRTNHILTNTGVWSPDSQWIAYDVRSDPVGEVFDGGRIEMIHVTSRRLVKLYEARNGAHCGVVTFHPREKKVIFIRGPESPTPDWHYCAWHRSGLIVETENPGRGINMDARDIVPPFTPGALRGGSHVHVWDGTGDWISFTYEDHVLAGYKDETPEHDPNLRNVGVSAPNHPVHVSHKHPRNQDGSHFSVLVTRTTANPEPGSDQISRAFEEGWIGTNGYARLNGSRQGRALAFQGQVLTARGESISEAFVVDLPDDPTLAGDAPLEGTATRRPEPPRGTRQRRLTFTADRKFPGIQGPRHWLRSSPDGSRIAFLMKDDTGVVQLWTVSPNGGAPRQVTRNASPIASAFTWSPDGRFVAHVLDNSACVSDAASGETTRITRRSSAGTAPLAQACVFAPDGKRIAYVRPVQEGERWVNQVFTVRLEL